MLMYIILLHVSGIALLEILFYFEYIGHVESQLFKNSIIRILNEPYNEEHKYIIFTPNITFADINKIKSCAKSLNAKILTTEKDYMKLHNDIDIKFLKIDIAIKQEDELINLLKSII